MQLLTQDLQSEITSLEIQLEYYEKLLDLSIRNNEIFVKTKVMYLEIKIISERLDKIKKMTMNCS